MNVMYKVYTINYILYKSTRHEKIRICVFLEIYFLEIEFSTFFIFILDECIF